MIDHFLKNPLVDALFDEARNILLLTTDTLQIVKINRSASIFFGISVVSSYGTQMGALLDLGGQARVKEIASMLHIDGETIRTNLSLVDYVGVRHHLLATVRYIICQNSETNYLLFSMRERRGKPDDPLRKIDAEALIHRLLKSFSDSVLLVSYESKVICECNLAAEMMFGYSRRELIGRSPFFLAPDEEFVKKYVEESRSGYASAGFFQGKMQCRRKNGSLFMTLATNFALFETSGYPLYILAINRDITLHEARLDDVVRLAEQSERLIKTLKESTLPLRTIESNESLSRLGFSHRQIAIAAVLVTGETTKAIARRFRISESAVKNHLSIMYRRLGVASRVEFVKRLQDRRIRIE